VLELAGVSKRFQRGREVVAALDNVDLTIAAGEFVGLVGPSGSGKSTLLHLAGGLDLPDAGTIRVAGRDVPSMSVGQRALLRRRQIGFVFQFFHLLPTLTVEENASLPLVLDRVRGDRRVPELLERVGLADKAKSYPGELSGGEMQRAAIVRALATRAGLILADEPTGNLDSATAADILAVLTEQVRDEGAALLLVTHDQAVASLADRILTLHDGSLVAT
jgi:ABC-type lipoprotein export system ATPase subunit